MKKKKKNTGKISKGVYLTLPELMMKKLEEEKEKFSYESVQEVIKDVLRDKFFKTQKETGANVTGRPRKINSQEIIARKKIFSKEGAKVQI